MNDTRRETRSKWYLRAAAALGIAAAAGLSSSAVWSAQSFACGSDGWPEELFCFQPNTPAKASEINGNFLTLSRQGPPPGAVMAYAGGAEPDGWLFCDGRQVSAANYPALFDALGYRYGGSGDAFNLPDLRDRYTAGASNMGGALSATTLGSNTAHHSHTISADHTHAGGSLGAHIHATWSGSWWHLVQNTDEWNSSNTFNGNHATNAIASWGWTDTAAYAKTKVSGTTSGGHSPGTDTTTIDNRPLSLPVKYIIRY